MVVVLFLYDKLKITMAVEMDTMMLASVIVFQLMLLNVFMHERRSLKDDVHDVGRLSFVRSHQYKTGVEDSEYVQTD